MVGAADVTNRVRERRSWSGERGDGRETKVIVSVIETSKRSSLEDLGGRGEGLVKGKRGTSAYGVADTPEREGLPGEKATEENQRQRNGELQKKGSLVLFIKVTTQDLIQLELSQIVLL